MTIFKRLSSVALATTMVASIFTGVASAAEPIETTSTGIQANCDQTDAVNIIESPNVQFEREDVSIETAMTDTHLSAEEIQQYVNENDDEPISRSVTWYCKGWYQDLQYNEVHYQVQRPCGLSEHKNGTTVLSTYHYTRTYLNKKKMYGDSGRIWGTGTVKAYGSLVDCEVCDLNTHYVKYGTTTN